MRKRLCVLFLIAAMGFSLFPISAHAAIDTQFKDTIASANGRVYVIQSDGSLLYWGKGTFNDAAGDQSPLRSGPIKVLDDVIGVYGDWWSGFAIKSDNSLWAIGDCADGNGGKHEDTDPPIKIMEDVVEIACAYVHWVALKTDGTVWQWSYNNDSFSSQKPKQIMSGVKQISASISSYYALKEDGTLWGWGENYSGALGVKTAETLIYSPIKIMDNVATVYGTGMEAYAIKTDGSLWGWGSNSNCIIFTGAGDEHAFAPYPDGSQSVVTAQFTPVKLLDDVKKIDGRNHLAVIKKDNSLWVWGNNDSGQLGIGTTQSIYTPTKVADNVIDVTAKGAFTIFLKNDGSLWGCGTNATGEMALGKFDNNTYTAPFQMMDNIAIPNTAIYLPSPWAKADIGKANELNLVPDALNRSYGAQITRAEFCALAVSLYEAVKGVTIIERKTFSDTNDINVEKMGALEVVNGIGNNLFDPGGTLTREQAATMLSRLAVVIGKPLKEENATFSDNDQISSWAFAQVGQVQTAGIMGGVGNNVFAPKDSYTREQSIITMLRLYNIVK